LVTEDYHGGVPIRVILAEDQRLVQEALAAVLGRDPETRVIGTAANGPQAIDMVLAERPDVLVLDIGLPQIDGIRVARTLRARMPEVRIVALSMHIEPHYVQEMLNAGAVAYVDKYSALEELGRAVRCAMQGRIYLSRAVTAASEAPVNSMAEPGALSVREREVLALLAAGRRSREIAAQLSLSFHTVEVHRRNIMRKLRLHGVADLTRYAIREGLISP
jgi:DNA-binding NarL/FixJ family response regulator